MNKKEMRLLFEKAFDDKGGFSPSDFVPAYVDAVNNGDFHDAVFYTLLMYIQGRMKDDPETQEILELVKVSIELLQKKNKKIPNNNLKRKPPSEGPYCSFCGKSKDEVQRLIAGPNTFICNECVDVCLGLIKKPNNAKKTTRSLKKTPKDKTKTTRRKIKSMGSKKKSKGSE